MTPDKGGKPQSPRTDFLAAALGRCTRCAKGRLFKSYLKLNPACSVCGCSFSATQTGDGAVVFVIMIVGLIVCGVFADVAITHPEISTTVEIMIFVPMAILLSLAVMPPFKGLMLAAQIKNRIRD